MPKGLGGVVDTTAQGSGKEIAHGGGGYFLSAKELSKQQRVELKKQLNEICTELNSAVSVMGREFELCNTLEGEWILHLRISCDGIEKEAVKDFSAQLKDCGLDAHRNFQPVNSNLGFLGADSGYDFIAVTGVRNGKTFEISDELRAFAENHPAKRSPCCNIL